MVMTKSTRHNVMSSSVTDYVNVDGSDGLLRPTSVEDDVFYVNVEDVEERKSVSGE